MKMNKKMIALLGAGTAMLFAGAFHEQLEDPAIAASNERMAPHFEVDPFGLLYCRASAA